MKRLIIDLGEEQTVSEMQSDDGGFIFFNLGAATRKGAGAFASIKDTLDPRYKYYLARAFRDGLHPDNDHLFGHRVLGWRLIEDVGVAAPQDKPDEPEGGF